jgi:uncharacterized protein YecE (DUF72 family)
LARAWVGTSGYTYPHWVGVLYPEGLPESRWFERYVQVFDAVELNVTFYRLPAPKTFEGWARRAPQDFAFVVKGSRYVTHVRRLREPQEPVRVLLDACRPLGDRLRCVLWQLPPRFRADPSRLREFLRVLPRTVQHAFEFRDLSWFTDAVYGLLAEHQAAVACADWPFQVLPPGMRPRRLDRPVVRVPHGAGWWYLRRHGPGDAYAGSYPDASLRADARWITGALASGHGGFVFFNNDVGGHAVRNALTLRRLLGQPAPHPRAAAETGL